MHEETLHLPAGQKKLKDDYRDPYMLPKINESDMAEVMEAMEEYIRLHQGVVRAPQAYVIGKTIQGQTYCEYPKYAIPDDEMIASMLHLPQKRTRSSLRVMSSPPKHIQQSMR